MIYDKNYKELKNSIFDFGKTTYGKIIFLICYSPFLISMIISIIFLINYIQYFYLTYLIYLIKIFAVSILLFCVGSYGFYIELRKFINKE